MMTAWSAVPTLDRVFDEAFRLATKSRGQVATFAAAVDVCERANEYLFQIDLPGVKLADLEITLENRVLGIRGERRIETPDIERLNAGRPSGQFAMSYALPDFIDEERLSADLADGVLTIRVPKHPKAMPRKIPISDGTNEKRLAE